MKDENEEEKEELELRRLQEIAKISSIYNRNTKSFERNKSISHVVHAVMHFAQFLCVLANELFHHIHHAINRKLREKDPEVPDLPEERNPIFFAYPICILISLVLCIVWLRLHTFSRTIDVSLAGCAVCIILMLLASISSMRHAEIHINLEEVSDDELLTHPIFIHNFIMCILSILSMVIYLIHFWVLYDCWRWREKVRAQAAAAAEASTPSSYSEDEPSTSRRTESALQGDLDPIATWEILRKKLLDTDQTDVENEPVILYCCCVDIWKYLKEREDRISMHEFQVVHVKRYNANAPLAIPPQRPPYAGLATQLVPPAPHIVASVAFARSFSDHHRIGVELIRKQRISSSSTFCRIKGKINQRNGDRDEAIDHQVPGTHTRVHHRRFALALVQRPWALCGDDNHGNYRRIRYNSRRPLRRRAYGNPGQSPRGSILQYNWLRSVHHGRCVGYRLFRRPQVRRSRVPRHRPHAGFDVHIRGGTFPDRRGSHLQRRGLILIDD